MSRAGARVEHNSLVEFHCQKGVSAEITIMINCVMFQPMNDDNNNNDNNSDIDNTYSGGLSSSGPMQGRETCPKVSNMCCSSAGMMMVVMMLIDD